MHVSRGKSSRNLKLQIWVKFEALDHSALSKIETEMLELTGLDRMDEDV